MTNSLTAYGQVQRQTPCRWRTFRLQGERVNNLEACLAAVGFRDIQYGQL